MGKIYIGQNLLADTKETMLSAASDVWAIFMWGSDRAPKGCLLCDGAEYSRTEYSQLFNVIGTTYGAGDGSTTFNLPDLRGRVLVQKSTDTEFNTIKKTGGAKTHQHDAGSLYTRLGNGVFQATWQGNWTASHTTNAEVTGPSSSVADFGIAIGGSTWSASTIQPYIVCRWIAKVLP